MTTQSKLKIILVIALSLLITLGFCGEYKKISGNSSKDNSSGKVQKIQNNEIKKNQKSYIVDNLPTKSERIKHKSGEYYINNGIYYKRVKRGYQVVKPPYGIKVKHLPKNVRYIKHRGVDYYYYYNTYYRWEPKLEVYVVIEEPDWAEKYNYEDRLNMVNGSVLIGKYLGGTQDKVEFLFGREVKKIPVQDIISIEFAPVIYGRD